MIWTSYVRWRYLIHICRTCLEISILFLWVGQVWCLFRNKWDNNDKMICVLLERKHDRHVWCSMSLALHSQLAKQEQKNRITNRTIEWKCSLFGKKNNLWRHHGISCGAVIHVEDYFQGALGAGVLYCGLSVLDRVLFGQQFLRVNGTRRQSFQRHWKITASEKEGCKILWRVHWSRASRTGSVFDKRGIAWCLLMNVSGVNIFSPILTRLSAGEGEAGTRHWDKSMEETPGLL